MSDYGHRLVLEQLEEFGKALRMPKRLRAKKPAQAARPELDDDPFGETASEITARHRKAVEARSPMANTPSNLARERVRTAEAVRRSRAADTRKPLPELPRYAPGSPGSTYRRPTGG